MGALRATAILKTDISGSTVRFRTLPGADLTALLAHHRELVGRVAAAHDGHIVKPEGDGFWVVFPSVTAAALAAMAMQAELRVDEAGKGDERLVMRIAITLGDVLHEQGALVGEAVVLAARIEALTPPDEIYISPAAWLAVNQAEVRATLVDAFALKGFAAPVAVYRIEQTYRTRVIADQYIVITDLGGFSAMVETAPMTEVEALLDRLHELIAGVCRDFDGTLRFSRGDSYGVTFADAKLALGAVERLAGAWRGAARAGVRCPMSVAVHKGALYAFRDFLYGTDLNVAARVERVASRHAPGDVVVVAVTGPVRRDLTGSVADARFERLDATPPALAGVEVYRLVS